MSNQPTKDTFKSTTSKLQKMIDKGIQSQVSQRKDPKTSVHHDAQRADVKDVRKI